MSLTDLLKDIFEVPIELYDRVDDYIVGKIRPLTQWCDEKAKGDNQRNLKYAASLFYYDFIRVRKENNIDPKFHLKCLLSVCLSIGIFSRTINHSLLTLPFGIFFSAKMVLSNYAKYIGESHTGITQNNENLQIKNKAIYNYNTILKHTRLGFGAMGTYILGDNLWDMTFGDLEFNYTTLFKDLALIYHTSFTTYLMQANDEGPRSKKPLFNRERQNTKSRIPVIKPSYT